MSVDPIPHPIEACLAAIEDALASLAGVGADGLDAGTLVRLLPRSQKVVSQAQSLLLKLTSATDDARAATSQSSTCTEDLLSSNHGGDRRESSRTVRTAHAINRTNIQKAMDLGNISLTQAEIIATTMTGIPQDLPDVTRAGCETELIAAAGRLTVKDLRRRADRISDMFNPHNPHDREADKIEQKTLKDREHDARGKTMFWMIDQHDGTHKGGFTIPEMHADMLKAMLDAIAAPRQDRQHRDNQHSDEIDAFGTLTWTRRQGLAFTEMLEHLPTEGLPAGSTTLTANFDFDFEHLRTGIGAATLSTGTRISIDQIRRLACEAKLIPMVFDGAPLPLDLGRDKRLFNRHQRIAIANRDLGCTFPGCDRPPNWCEIHHAHQTWANGGQTNLEDGVLLCSFHHHRVHDDGWTIQFTDDGHPEYTPPRTIDFRQPRRNQRWRAPSLTG